eukprot:CAMPEP_0202712698 /NCGR_PEP_ID=MMETSP1385-20130828/44208_1 /ASSEMBLY_ACC=CAM_ASM_000861 /TAXON_ID=933848 /ORGANISM="Elphidium margaritaceum" /LENGTH=476 /DNA_ID=CAMNT_0049372805 /DNA_START=33 /DNA_END=1460 /DNA_ORIENTATION=+
MLSSAPIFVTAYVWLLSCKAENICPNSAKACNSDAGECCSSGGWCGTGAAWCDDPYQFPGEGSTPAPVPAGWCQNSGRVCDRTGECCSEFLYCGTTAEYCGGPTAAPVPTPAPVPTVAPDPFDKGCKCKCWGDPHCQMWNCHTNNYQGPHGVNPPGRFYYLTPCAGRGYTNEDMPFEVIGVHQRYDGYFSSMDYEIVKLYGSDGTEYCIKVKGNEPVAYNTDCSDTFDETPQQGETITLGEEFEFSWQNVNGNAVLTVDVLTGNGAACGSDIVITSNTATVSEEGVQFEVSDCFKRYTCGMCGNFYDTELNFERVDGTYVALSEGCWGGTANADDGLSYLLDGTMGTARRRLIDTDSEPCYGLLESIEAECATEISFYAECCDARRTFCDSYVVPGCSWDACSCVMGANETAATATDSTVVQDCVEETTAATMAFTCSLPATDFDIPESLYDTLSPTSEPTEDGSSDSSEASRAVW